MNTALVPVGSTLVVPNKRLHITGFDGLDESDQAIPYIRGVQPTSTECELMDASDAKTGQFYDTALMKAHNEFQFAVLSVAKFDVTWQEDREPQRVYLLLCADPDYFPFVPKGYGMEEDEGRRYAPALRADPLHRLWELKQKSEVPMPRLLTQAVEEFLFRLEE